MKLLSLFSLALAYPGDDRASCEQNIIANRIHTCESQNYSLSYCARYINDEMVRTCRGSYNCIVGSKKGDWASWRNYDAMGDRKNMKNKPIRWNHFVKYTKFSNFTSLYAMCGKKDGSNAVNKSILQTSCRHAVDQCSSAGCVRKGPRQCIV